MAGRLATGHVNAQRLIDRQHCCSEFLEIEILCFLDCDTAELYRARADTGALLGRGASLNDLHGLLR